MRTNTSSVKLWLVVPTFLVVGCNGEIVDGADVPASLESALTIDVTSPYTITGVASGKCLQPSGGSRDASAQIQIATCNGSPAQQFLFSVVSSRYYSIKNAGSGLCLDVQGRRTSDGAAIIQYPCSGATNQQFAIQSSGTSSVSLTARHSGKRLDVLGRGTADGTNVVQWAANGGANQAFLLGPVGSKPDAGVVDDAPPPADDAPPPADAAPPPADAAPPPADAAPPPDAPPSVPDAAPAVPDAATPAAGFYTWPAYSPNIAYDYGDEYGTIPPPTSVAEDCSGVAGTYTSGWWTFRYGAKKNSLVTSAAWVPMLQRFNTDFTYITDVMRWPRDGRARNGNYSAIYLYGSGLSTDSASNTDTGGWQSWSGNGPIVLASYYPVYSFDPASPYGDKVAQQGAMIHEGIHSILATMPGVKNACWFHEGGNTWLQSTMEAKRSGTTPTEMGWLSAGAAIAPFMPIETYSGWLQDDSFGGPCAERVNRTDSSGQQVCTWRNLLGGTQYGEAFPHALEVILGEKSIAWIWRYAQSSGRVLQDLAEVSGGLGPTQTRRLIQEYRARQAFSDFGKWSNAYKKLLNDNWNVNIGPEWSPSWINAAVWKSTCYVATTQSGSTLTPEARTLPGWSGANQIPLTVNPSATSATVTFNPTGANMSCQLVYRDNGGDIRYGTPVSNGACSIPLSNVKNNVVVAVIANTTYIYDGGTTKYAYTLTLGSGVTSKADIATQWYK